jgi:hypothetical protein
MAELLIDHGRDARDVQGTQVRGRLRLMDQGTGTVLVIVGLAIVVIGLLAATGALGWFGRLPGDIRYERGNTIIYAPIVSMLLVSVVLSLLLWAVQRLR